MGVDFIRKHAKKFNKGWDRDRMKLSTPDLFTRYPERTLRAVVGQTRSGCQVPCGTDVVVRVVEDRAVAIQDITAVADLLDLPEDVLEAVRECGGHVNARVTRVADDGGALEVELW
jgi:hypothetical protein